MTTTKTGVDRDTILKRYLDVWTIADDAQRRAAVAGIWATDGVEFVEGLRFEGHAQLAERVKRAHDAFIGSGRFVLACGDDAAEHGDMLVFTARFAEPAADGSGGAGAGEIAWAARVFLLLDDDGYVQQSYQLTVKPLPPA